MKTNLGNAIGMVRQMAVNYNDQTLDLKEMSFNSLDSMTICGREIEVLISAQKLFANRLRVPHSYLLRCPPELQAENLNYWLRKEEKQRDTLFCRFDDHKLRAVFTDRYKVLDNLDILEKMVEYGFRPDTEVHLNLNQSVMCIKVPDYTRMFDFASEKLVPGIAISNSEVGILAFSIEAYFYRLVCTNGMIAKTEVSSKFRHVSQRALEEFNNIVREVILAGRFSQDRLAVTMEREIEDPLRTIHSFNRRFNVAKNEEEIVEQAWSLEPGKTMWHIINAYSRAAQNRALTAEESHKLERIGGYILALMN